MFSVQYISCTDDLSVFNAVADSELPSGNLVLFFSCLFGVVVIFCFVSHFLYGVIYFVSVRF